MELISRCKLKNSKLVKLKLAMQHGETFQFCRI